MLSYDAVNAVVYYTLSGASIFLAIPFFYIIMCHSPSSLRLYRNTIINLTMWYFLAVQIDGLFLQLLFTTHDSQMCGKYVGLASYLGRSATIAFLFLCIISATNAGVSILICFIFRYVQISNCSMSSYFKWFKVMCVALHLTFSLAAVFMTYLFISSAHVFEVDDVLHVCFDERNSSTMTTVSIVSISLIVVGTFSVLCLVWMSLKALRSLKSSMTKETYRLQLLLTINLVVVVLLPGIFSVVPIVFTCFCIYFKCGLLPYSISLAAQTPFLDSISMCIATLAFITPYREANYLLWHEVMAMLMKCMRKTLFVFRTFTNGAS
uniref:G_PROTEIN_RECEP_F1_2 domain-containing protein n=1 Tax=Steinernema glaseri TaxID=37863 RepID=A0A1I7ZMS0_9BILA